ncbi:MAG: cupredoxin domain-containing protein [Jatrophihabitantaceae bacterium]
MFRPARPGARRIPVAGLKSAAPVGAALMALSMLLAGCQTESAIQRNPHVGSTTASVTAGVQEVVITTDQNYRFTPTAITVHPGKVRITLKHVGTGAPHDWSLVDFPADYVPLVSAGQTKSVEFQAPAPGTYKFVCTIHIAQGQTGTLIVLPT